MSFAVLVFAAEAVDRMNPEIVHQQTSPQVQDVLAWVTREGVTNIPRHFSAGNCAIRAGNATALSGYRLPMTAETAPRRTFTSATA